MLATGGQVTVTNAGHGADPPPFEKERKTRENRVPLSCAFCNLRKIAKSPILLGVLKVVASVGNWGTRTDCANAF